MTLLHVTLNIPPEAVAAEMTRLLAYPESDAETLANLYRLAVENLRKEEK